MKKKLLSLLVAVSMSIGAMACGAYETEDTAADASTADTGSGSEKVFRYSDTVEPTTIDPSKANSIVDNELIHACQESLVRGTGGKVEPGIAESWELSEDGLTYTFHLRDTNWSDGQPVTADDFVYGLQRLLDPATASEYAFIGEYVKNGYAVETGEMEVSELGVRAEDDKTLVLELENPCAYFLSMVGIASQYVPIRKDIVESYGADFAATADKNVYSGPFKLVSTDNMMYVFEKNDQYWNKDAINLDRVEFSVISESNTAVAMYENGELDFVKLPTDSVAQYDDIDSEFMNGNEDYLYINEESTNKIVSNKNFRKALNYGLNRNDYIALATNNVYSPSNTLVMPLVGGASKSYGEEYTLDSYPLDGDIDVAKEYLEKAMSEEGYSDPSEIEIELTTTDLEASKKIAEVLQELWQNALGITVTIRQVTYADIYGSVLPNGDYQIAYGGWGPDYSDPYTYLELFKSDCSYNYSNYKNDEFDKLLEDSKTETDVKARMDMLNEAEKIILEDAAFVPLQCRQQHYLLNDKFTGVEFYFCSINIDWVYADVE